MLLPFGGISGLDVRGGPFHDPEADASLFEAIRLGLADHPKVEVIDRPEHINDPGFARFAAATLIRLIRSHPRPGPPLP